MRLKHAISLLFLLISPTLWANSPPPDDPLKSVQWVTMYNLFLNKHPVIFDNHVQIIAPDSAEDSMHVPVVVNVDGLNDIQEILIFADFNPLPKVLRFIPNNARPYIGFRLKLQQATPVRAAVLTSTGWHVGGIWVDATGGGCTLPSTGRTTGTWETTLGQIRGRLWAERTPARAKFQIMHPMDTGLAKGIPTFHLEKITLAQTDGKTALTLEPFEPISENPIFTVELTTPQTTMILNAIDTNGNEFKGELKQ
ncbi:sulfur oxidation protein SoxZ [Beggiatoa alba B18LD]|uniref:Sulfur oxidation protein SoxZ n=1 Tax=Beggiatoa alba B18LD TaxID=395493 RepID=I3CIE6_9GAMM|nr:quinoprotein dehydrogenase-associated SoxYZ-like carrier [Beggiatoa alba]EIJ43389.1 sulfur oxidation protein SoxZ [Beggiatoa alba B18LD]